MTPRAAALLMTAGMGCYAANDALVKAAASALPTGQLLTLRGALACLILVALERLNRQRVAPRDIGLRRTQMRSPMLMLRCALEVTTAGFSVLALANAPLATVSAIMMSAPLLVMLCSCVLGWEPWHKARLVVAGGGLAGVLLVLQPDASMPAAGAGIAAACLCAASLAGRDVATRRLPSQLSSTDVAALATAAVCAGGILLAPLETWAVPHSNDVVLVAMAALCAALGNLALVVACRSAPLSLIAPYRYSFIVWATALGFLVWGEMPGLWQTVGIVLLVVGGVLGMRDAKQR